MMNTPEGPQRCAACNPRSGQQLPQFRTCPHCHSQIYKWDRNPCESHIAVTRITGAA
jgi:Zn finger protein HypA/HybF involved in hydrogenase expression